MNKMSGNQSDFAFIREDASRIVIGYDCKKITGKSLYEWYEIYLPKKQNAQLTFQMVKKAIENDINSRVDEKILCSYPWTVLHGDDAGKNVKVWLSKENQSNFKAKYDLHFTKPEALTFPTIYKIAEDDDHNAVFEVFQSFEELEAFYLGGIAYIEQCYQSGWLEKRNMDWAPYEEYFPKNDNNSQE